MFARPGLPGFDYVRPGSLDEAVALLQEHRDEARLMMGGTDLLPGLRNGLFRPKVVVDVKHLPGMRDIEFDEQAGLTLGAAVTMNQLATHPVVLSQYPLLAEAASTVASYQIRNRATLGGNLCNASPCADTAPATLLLGPGQTLIQSGELMRAIHFPPLQATAAACYHKLGRCKSGDLSLVGVAVLGFPDGTASGYGFRVGLGSVAPTPIRVTAAEEFLSANPPGEAAFAQAAEKAMAAASPITDVRGTAEYQTAMVRALTLRGLREVWAQMKEGE
jgi:CO/xanthine dehydrogenase FAD-binding subunit